MMKACLQCGNKGPQLTTDSAAAAAKTVQLNPSDRAEQNNTEQSPLTISDLSSTLQSKKQDVTKNKLYRYAVFPQARKKQ